MLLCKCFKCQIWYCWIPLNDRNLKTGCRWLCGDGSLIWPCESGSNLMSCRSQQWIGEIIATFSRSSSEGSRASTHQLRAKPCLIHYSSAFVTFSPTSLTLTAGVRDVVHTEGILRHCALLTELICCHLCLSCWWTCASQGRFCMHISLPAEMVPPNLFNGSR